MAFTDEMKLKTFDAVFYELIGGRHVASILALRLIENRNYHEIAQRYDMPKAQVWKLVTKAAAKMKNCGLWRKEWDEHICRKSKYH